MNADAENLIAAGNAAYAQGRFVEAAELGRKAAAADARNPWAHNLLGAACAEEMEFEESRQAFTAAVAADPSIALSRANLAYALILAGEFAEAEAHLREALRLEPDFGAAFINLTWIHKAQTGDPLIARLEDLRRRGDADAQSRVHYCFALGKCYDDIGEYDLAFACFREGNELSGVRFPRDAWADYFGRIRGVFTQDFIRVRAAHGWRSAKPAFIVGMPRCGSSLLEDRLARHPAVSALGERPDIARLLAGLRSGESGGARWPDFAPGLAPETFGAFGRRYVEKFERIYPQATRFLDKNLLNFHHAGLVRVALPDAFVVHCRRDALDTCLSCYFQLLRPHHAYKFDLASLGLYYRMYAELMAHWETAGVVDAVVDYEVLASEPESEFARILTALSLEPGEVAAETRSRSIQTSSAFQARQPVTRSSIGRWKNYEKHLGPLVEALGPLARL